jgi:hypothetical protein
MKDEDEGKPMADDPSHPGSCSVPTPPVLAAAPAARPTLPADQLLSESRLVRGLSALFWGLPVALVVCVQTARTSFFAPLGVVPPLLVNGFLFYALAQLGCFRGEQVQWQGALERTRLLALVNMGLSPFLYWWKIMPHVSHYQVSVAIMALCSLLFLFSLNRVLQRLGDMLQDDAVRLETRLFTTFNLYVLTAILLVVACWPLVRHWQEPPAWLLPVVRFLLDDGVVLLLFLVLVPIAVTMAILWKIKETVLGRFFGQRPP